ncbi:unnamed protein product [Strongylus vulgaris]|uniref:Tyrosine aminotransferase n=1 Tax=Strongylus vulgaris TaxID=40348 RepID=A0A3P7JTM7_STRVU|nr:unnamed protein product [Strongylus vulgaris]
MHPDPVDNINHPVKARLISKLHNHEHVLREMVTPNPNKSLIKLHLGDPTLTGALPPSKVAVDALVEATTSHMFDGYGPAVGALAAREAVAIKYSHPEAPINADDVILASGCSHALQMAIEGLANPGDNILIPQPGFPLYSTLCRPHGIEDRAYKVDMANGGQIDLEYLETLIDDRTQALIVNNPGNPTGVVFSKEHLQEILAGLVALSQKIVGPCSIIQGALPKILRDTPNEYFEHNRRIISRNAGIVNKSLKGVKGVHCLKPHGAMYMMISVDKTLYGDDIHFSSNLIQEESVFCLPGTAFSSPGWIRLVLTQTEEISQEAALRIRSFCERHLDDLALADIGESSDEGCDISNSEPF